MYRYKCSERRETLSFREQVGRFLQPGSVYGHALPQISGGIQPSLPADYLILSAEACFGWGQRAYCQATKLTFIMQDKGKKPCHDLLFCAVLALVPVCKREVNVFHLPLSKQASIIFHSAFGHLWWTALLVFHTYMSDSSTLPFFRVPLAELFSASQRLKLFLI